MSPPAPERASRSNDTTPLHVLDIPQLHTKPSFSLLLSALHQLTLSPPSWDTSPRTPIGPIPTAAPRRPIDETGVPAYLTRIIASPLTWIPNPNDRERIWDEASKRLAERSGRAAIPSYTRVFHIPLTRTYVQYDGRECCPSRKEEEAREKEEVISIKIHEPSLTGDNLGHKTWVSSYLLAKRLRYLFTKHVHPAHQSHNIGKDLPVSTTITNPTLASTDPNLDHHHLRILELGAGTGLVGLTAAALFTSPSFPTNIHLTDLPPIVPNLQHNIALNAATLQSPQHTRITAGVLDWSQTRPSRVPNDGDEGGGGGDKEEEYDTILAADSLYAPEHATWLATSMNVYLAPPNQNPGARIFVELPLREPSAPEHDQFRTEMSNKGFEIVEEGVEVGYDDWEEKAGHGQGLHEQVEVECWWSVWKRRQSFSH